MTTNSTPTTATEVWLMPDKASLASSTPVTYRIPTAQRNTTSERNLVNNRTVNIPSTVMIVIHASTPNPKKVNESMLSEYYYFTVSFSCLISGLGI